MRPPRASCRSRWELGRSGWHRGAGGELLGAQMVAASCSRLPFPLLRVSMQVTPEPVRSFRSPPGRGRIQTPAQMLYPTKIPSPEPGMGMEQGGSWTGRAGQRDRGTEGPTPRQVAQRRIWDRGRDSTGPARTHRTRARRDRRAWRASVAAGPAAAWHGAAGPVGMEGHKVPCRGWGRESPPWQERCGETGAGAAGQHRGHPTDPPAPSFPRGGTPEQSPCYSTGRTHQPHPRSPKPSRGKGLTPRGLWRRFSGLEVFSGSQPQTSLAAQVSYRALRDTRGRLQP